MEQNLITVICFVQIQIKGVANQVNDLLKDNEVLERSLEFSLAEIDALKNQARTKPSLVPHKAVPEIRNRIRQLEDSNRRNTS